MARDYKWMDLGGRTQTAGFGYLGYLKLTLRHVEVAVIDRNGAHVGHRPGTDM
jgi:hypothetical protein